jgi:hypothetical protein
MPRYFFNVRAGEEILPDDEEGQELATMDDVRREALAGAREILSEAAFAGTAGGLDHDIEVTDENGIIVLRQAIGRVVDTDSQT